MNKSWPHAVAIAFFVFTARLFYNHARCRQWTQAGATREK